MDTKTEIRKSSHRPDEKDYVQIIEVDHQHNVLHFKALMKSGCWTPFCSIEINGDAVLERDYRLPLLLKIGYSDS